MPDIFLNIGNDLLSLLDQDIGWLFLGFYGFCALMCGIMLFMCAGEKGLFRHMLLANAMLCIFFAGVVACLAVLDIKQPRTVISETRVIREGGGGIKAGNRLESLGPKAPPEVKEIVIDPRRAYERAYRAPAYDGEGNLLEDNLSHEDNYPDYRED